MPKDDSGNPGGGRIEIELLHVVEHVDALAAKLHHLYGRQIAAWSMFIDVASNRCDRRDVTQFSQNGRIANIAGVQYMVRSLQFSQSLRP